MDLIPYAARLHRDLRVAAEPGGDQVVEVAERLVASLESSTRLVLLDALVEAAAEITNDLGPGAVEVRLRGREVDFVVTPPVPVSPTSAAAAPATVPATAPATAAAAEPLDDTDEGGTARLSLRLPERLKPRVEQAAEAAGLSVNAWLVRTIGTALDTAPIPSSPAPPPTTTASTGQRQTGWAR